MRISIIFLVATASLGLAGCQKAATGGNEAQAANEAASANTAGVESGGTPAATNGEAPAATNAETPATAQRLSFRGCPILNPVEGGCLTVRSGGTTYDINSARPRPDPAKRLMIDGTGVPGGASICMTGTVLTDVKWSYMKTSCPIDDGNNEEKKHG